MGFRFTLLVVLCAFTVSRAAESIALSERDSLSDPQAAALSATAQAVSVAGYDPHGFRARVTCGTETCEVEVFPEELESEEYEGWRGCPLKYCATIIFSIKQDKIVRTTHWR